MHYSNLYTGHLGRACLAASGAFTETYAYNAIGNMMSKAGLTYNYSDTLHKHAVTGLSDGSSYQYDANGNMRLRVEGGVAYTQTWDIDNLLTSVAKENSTAQYYYDADGALVRKVEPRGQTIYASSDYEVFYPTVVTVAVPSTFTHTLYMPFVSNAQTNGPCHDACTYYQFNGQQVAVRTGGIVYWLHSDHLGSASATTDINGTKVIEQQGIVEEVGDDFTVDETTMSGCDAVHKSIDAVRHFVQHRLSRRTILVSLYLEQRYSIMDLFPDIPRPPLKG